MATPTGRSTYLAYVPFEQVIPWPGSLRPGDFEQPKPGLRRGGSVRPPDAAGSVPARPGHAACGRRAMRLGLALAYAWAAFPFALLTLRYSFNDTVVGLLALLGGGRAPLPVRTRRARRPGGRNQVRPARTRAAARHGHRGAPGAFVAAICGRVRGRSPSPSTCRCMPDGGISELYDRTLGYQEERRGWVRLFWASLPELNWLQTLVSGRVAALAVAAAFVPRRKTPFQVVALAAALLIARRSSPAATGRPPTPSGSRRSPSPACSAPTTAATRRGAGRREGEPFASSSTGELAITSRACCSSAT